MSSGTGEVGSVDLVLNALSETGGASRTGPELQRETGLSPAQIDDAVSLLELVELVRCTYFQGSAPFSFTSVELSQLAKLQHEQPVDLSNEEQFKAIKDEMRGIWSRAGADPFPRFSKILRASNLSAAQVSELLDVVPPRGTGTTGANCERLHGILSRVCEERRQQETTVKTAQDTDRVAAFVGRVRQHPVGAFVVLLFLFFGALAEFTSAIGDIESYVKRHLAPQQAITSLEVTFATTYRSKNPGTDVFVKAGLKNFTPTCNPARNQDWGTNTTATCEFSFPDGLDCDATAKQLVIDRADDDQEWKFDLTEVWIDAKGRSAPRTSGPYELDPELPHTEIPLHPPCQ